MLGVFRHCILKVYQTFLLGESINGCFRPFWGNWEYFGGMLGVLKSILRVNVDIVGVVRGMLVVFRHH